MTQNDLISKILHASNVIANSTKNNGNFIITSSSVAEAFYELERKEKYDKRKRIIDKLLKGDS